MRGFYVLFNDLSRDFKKTLKWSTNKKSKGSVQAGIMVWMPSRSQQHVDSIQAGYEDSIGDLSHDQVLLRLCYVRNTTMDVKTTASSFTLPVILGVGC